MMRLPQTLVALALCGVLSSLHRVQRCARLPQARLRRIPSRHGLDAHALYKQNCAGCHGDNGRGGAAIPLNNPAYLAVAGADNLRTTITRGIPGTLMPAFAASSGGMLTDKQIDALVQGIVSAWARPADFSGVPLPPYAANTQGNASRTATSLRSCVCALPWHRWRRNETGSEHECTAGINFALHRRPVLSRARQRSGSAQHRHRRPARLERTDWRSYIPGRALSPQQITDIVAWLATHRTSATETSHGRASATARPTAQRKSHEHISTTLQPATQSGRFGRARASSLETRFAPRAFLFKLSLALNGAVGAVLAVPHPWLSPRPGTQARQGLQLMGLPRFSQTNSPKAKHGLPTTAIP